MGETTITAVPRVRSALFMPADRDDFLAKAAERGADGVILDLEDSIPETRKAAARSNAAAWISASSGERGRPVVFVRVNHRPGALEADLEEVVRSGLRGVVLPKVESPDDVRKVASLVAFYEGKAGIPFGTVRIWPLVESAHAVALAFEIASASPRVAYMGGGAGEEGDLAFGIGFQWGEEFLETLYLRSKVLLDVRNAGVPNPMTGMVTRLDDDSIGAFARQSRQLGYEGMMVIHPDHVDAVNAAFTPTASEVEDARGILEALRLAALEGRASVAYRGRMLDTAMARNAESVLLTAEAVNPDGPAGA